LKIKLNPSHCVRYYSKNSQCDLCESICPTEAVKIEEAGVALYQDECVSCGGCVGVCPNEALSLTNFDVTEFFFEFLGGSENIISCKSNFVCLSGLNIEYLVALGLLKSDVVLDLGHCESCDINKSCFPQIERNIKEANLILQALDKSEIQSKNLCISKEEEPNRREFFNIFNLKSVVKAKKNFDESVSEKPLKKITNQLIKAIKDKTIPNKRKVLFTVLKKIKKPQSYTYLDRDEVSFTSAKIIDDSCDNCSICYRVCPTSALSSNQRGSKIFFDDLLCIKCRLCHDVCEKESISLKDVSTKEFFEPSQKLLKEFKVIKCHECGNPFSYLGGERICKRCKEEEEGAMELWGMN